MTDVLSGKTAVVTGSSRGIGAGIARTLAGAGCRMMLTGRDEAALAETAAAITDAGGSCALHAADLTRKGAPAALVERMRQEFGRIDIVVANAGDVQPSAFLTTDEEGWQKAFALKFFAHAHLARAAWPMLRESKGSWISIAGTAARTARAHGIVSSPVNAAIVAFAKGLADLGKQDGVQVNCINPGTVDTGRYHARMRNYMKEHGVDEATARRDMPRAGGFTRIGQPEDIGALALFVLGPHGRYFHGSTIDMEAGFTQTL